MLNSNAIGLYSTNLLSSNLKNKLKNKKQTQKHLYHKSGNTKKYLKKIWTNK